MSGVSAVGGARTCPRPKVNRIAQVCFSVSFYLPMSLAVGLAEWLAIRAAHVLRVPIGDGPLLTTTCLVAYAILLLLTVAAIACGATVVIWREGPRVNGRVEASSVTVFA